MKKNNDYPFITRWHKETGSYDNYISDQIEKARKDNAPQNAIYYDATNKRWITTDEIQNDNIIQRWGLPTKPNKFDLLILLTKSILTDEAQTKMETEIANCENFKKFYKLKSIIEFFII